MWFQKKLSRRDLNSRTAISLALSDCGSELINWWFLEEKNFVLKNVFIVIKWALSHNKKYIKIHIDQEFFWSKLIFSHYAYIIPKQLYLLQTILCFNFSGASYGLAHWFGVSSCKIHWVTCRIRTSFSITSVITIKSIYYYYFWFYTCIMIVTLMTVKSLFFFTQLWNLSYHERIQNSPMIR